MAILLALGSALVYGVADYCGGRSSRFHPAAVVTLIGQTVSLLIVGTLVLLGDAPMPDGATLAWSLGGGAAGAFALLALYHAFAHGAMTVVAPLSAVVGAAVPVIAGRIVGERPAGIAYVGIALAIVAVALVSGAIGGRRQPTPPRIAGLAAIAGLGFGLWFVALDRCADDAGMWPLLMSRSVSVPIMLGVCVAIGARPGVQRRLLGLAVVAGVLDMTANGLYLEATRHGLLSLVAVISSLYPASTVALAFVIDRERGNRWQVLGMALAAVSLVLVTLGKA
jgi:drug/metabolite transporter (DMT)-like permease